MIESEPVMIKKSHLRSTKITFGHLPLGCPSRPDWLRQRLGRAIPRAGVGCNLAAVIGRAFCCQVAGVLGRLGLKSP